MSSSKRWPKWPILFLPGIAIAACLVRFVFLFDAAAFVRQYESDQLRRAGAGESLFSQAELAELARFHRGPGPCLGYAPPAPSPEAIRTIADEFAGAGLLSTPSTVDRALNLMNWWTPSDEEARHGDVSDEERLVGFHHASWSAKAEIWLNRRKIILAIRANHRQSDDLGAARLKYAEASLDPATRARLRSIWEAHRFVLAPVGLLALKRELEKRVAFEGHDAFGTGYREDQ
jgi:hypothetical protein